MNAALLVRPKCRPTSLSWTLTGSSGCARRCGPAGTRVRGSPTGSAPRATAALRRNDLRAALRATTDRDPLGTLIRLFVCARTEPRAAVAAALTVEVLEAAGLLQRDGEGLRSAVDLEPYGEDWWVVSDLTGGPPAPDHVLGVGGASSCGSPTPPRAGTSGGPSSGWTGSTGTRSRRSGSGWSRCGAPGTRTPSSGSRTCARPWTSRSGTRWRPGSTARTAARGRPA